jgi:hypothetical protein
MPVDAVFEPKIAPEPTLHPLPFDAFEVSTVASSAATSRFASHAMHTEPRYVVAIAERESRRSTAPAPSAEVRERRPVDVERPVPDASDTTLQRPGVTLGGGTTTPPSIGLGLGTPNPFLAREEPPNRASSSRTAVHENVLREPARLREQEIGLGPEGPVLQALGRATTTSSAPVHGRAVFLAVADRTGVIVSVDVLECDGARSGWAHAADLARAALNGQKLRLPSTASGAELRIEITSDWKIPSGHDTGTDVSVLGMTTQKGDGKDCTKVAILDVLPKRKQLKLSKDLEISVVTIEGDAISISGDAANSGAKPRRIVHTRLLASKML